MSDEEHSEPFLQCAAGDRGIRARESSPIKKAAQSERPFGYSDPRMREDKQRVGFADRAARRAYPVAYFSINMRVAGYGVVKPALPRAFKISSGTE